MFKNLLIDRAQKAAVGSKQKELAHHVRANKVHASCQSKPWFTGTNASDETWHQGKSLDMFKVIPAFVDGTFIGDQVTYNACQHLSSLGKINEAVHVADPNEVVSMLTQAKFDARGAYDFELVKSTVSVIA